MALRRLCRHAQVLTPNLTEACLLTDTPYKEAAWSEAELKLLCQKLSKLCPGSVVITGLHEDDHFRNICWEDHMQKASVTPATGKSRPGTGDLFASILVAELLRGKELFPSVQRAADFVALCIRGTEAADVPVQEGVLLEKFLPKLL